MKRVGFWRQREDEESELPHPRALVDAAWPLVERVRVATYLRKGRTACAWRGYSFCRFDCGVPFDQMGTRDLTDEEWVWPEGFAHYVEHHAVRPPAEFLDAVAQRLPMLLPTWRLGAAYRAAMLRRRIEAARREAEADALLPPHTTPLHEAAQRGDLAAAIEALASSAVDARDRLGQTPLHVAARAGQREMVTMLLARGASVHSKTSSDITPLGETRGVEVTRILLDAGAAIEPEPVAHATPLTAACMSDDLARVTLLLDRGASPNRSDRFRSPLEASISAPVVELLLARGADATKGHPLASVARHGDVAVVRLLLAHGAELEAKDSRKQTALFHAASAKGGDDVVEVLLAAGADPSSANDLGDTPLHVACARTSLVTVRRLLEARAPIKTKSKRGMTPLHWAALAPERRHDSAAVLELLLAAGATGLDVRDEWGRTPVDIARERNDERALEVLRRSVQT
jgi:ankyrin repeat protein